MASWFTTRHVYRLVYDGCDIRWGRRAPARGHSVAIFIYSLIQALRDLEILHWRTIANLIFFRSRSGLVDVLSNSPRARHASGWGSTLCCHHPLPSLLGNKRLGGPAGRWRGCSSA